MGMEKIADRAEYWCAVADLGYDQSNRWDIRPDGGETDCSALALHCVYEAGYKSSPFTWGNTDSMPQQLEELGFKKVRAGVNPPRGVIRLRPGHTAISLGNGRIAQASIDEHGNITGGKGGDQTGRETNISNDPNNWTWDFYAPDAPVSSGVSSSGGSGLASSKWPCKGWKGAEVKKLQQALIDKGYSCGSAGVDGDFGKDTDAAVRRFQADNGLEVDGIVGQKTQAALYGSAVQLAKPATSSYPPDNYVTIVDCLNVRTGAGTGNPKKSKSDLTADGKRHSNSAGQLNSGTTVTVMEVTKVGDDWWGRIPSGWICLEYQGKPYVRKA